MQAYSFKINVGFNFFLFLLEFKILTYRYYVLHLYLYVCTMCYTTILYLSYSVILTKKCLRSFLWSNAKITKNSFYVIGDNFRLKGTSPSRDNRNSKSVSKSSLKVKCPSQKSISLSFFNICISKKQNWDTSWTTWESEYPSRKSYGSLLNCRRPGKS